MKELLLHLKDYNSIDTFYHLLIKSRGIRREMQKFDFFDRLLYNINNKIDIFLGGF
jgi:hypothetical protein